MEILRADADGIIVLQVHAKALDAGIAGEFKSYMAPLLVPGIRLVIDLEKVGFVDSTGLGVLVSSLRQARVLEGEIKLCSLTKPVRALFELVRMHRVFEILNTRDEALIAYGTTSQPTTQLPQTA
jgi:anti-sigma B factor antagonist